MTGYFRLVSIYSRGIVLEITQHLTRLRNSIKARSNAAVDSIGMSSAGFRENKAGLQLIQTLTLATGSDYASAEINIDWSQWAEVYVDFQLAYSGPMKSYDLFFTPNNNYLVRTAYGTHMGIVLHPLFNENLSVEGTTFSGSAVNVEMLYKDVTGIGVYLTASSGKTAVISSGTTVKFYGRK